VRTPRPAGTAIDARRRSTWQRRFASYRQGVTEQGILDWLNAFENRDRDTAARLLDAVEFVSAEQIHGAFRSLLSILPGWHIDPNRRNGKFVFVAFSTSAGESGDNMLHQFRLANNLNHRQFDPLFIGRSDLLRADLGTDDTVVFVDDFVGTGNQAVTAWEKMFQELTTEVGNVYLATVAAYQVGSNEIKNKTRMQLLAHRALSYRQSLFHDNCQHFTPHEKQRILHYCKVASPNHPRGFGDCALAVVLYHQCPNNSLAVLHAASRNWDPLFPRS
jgi:hypothetical protein